MSERKDILEYLQCMVNTETPTPLKVVHKMIDLIDPLKLVDDDAKILCPCCKDGIFLREIVVKILQLKKQQLGEEQFKNNQDNILKHILKNRIFGIAISYRGYRTTKRTIYGCDGKYEDIDNIFFNEELGEYMQDKDGNKTEKQCLHFTKNFNEVKQFFTVKGVNDMKFDIIIGNPPYQMQTGGKSHQLYLQFFKKSFELARQSIMIFPTGWMRASGKGSGMVLAPEIRQAKGIVSVDVYFEDVNRNSYIIFPNVGTSGVNIVNWQKDYNNNGFVDYYEYGELKGKKDLTVINEKNEIDLTILNKTKTKTYFDSLVSGWNPFGVQSSLLANPTKYGFEKYIKTKLDNNSVEILDANWGTKKWYIIDNNINYREIFSNKLVKIKLDNLSKWKVCYGKMGANTIYRQLFIIEPNKIVSDSYLCIFTDTKRQAENVISFLKTYFVRYLISLNTITFSAYRNVFQSVPDISNKQNPRTNKIGWDSDWNDGDLQKLFNLTDKEMNYIKQQAIASDNGRGDYEAENKENSEIETMESEENV